MGVGKFYDFITKVDTYNLVPFLAHQRDRQKSFCYRQPVKINSSSSSGHGLFGLLFLPVNL